MSQNWRVQLKRKRINFRSAPLRGQAEYIGVRGNQILGAVVMQAGALNDDRPWHIDTETLRQVAEFGNRRKAGLKARFTHPNVSDDGMGKYLGRWENFRVDEDGQRVRADLTVSPRADESPVGEIGSYVLGLAEDEPDMFGVSIVADIADEMHEADEDSELFNKETNTTAFRISDLYAADVVDEPAATRGGLFDTNGLPDLPAMVTRVLDTHFSDATPDELLERFQGFLRKYFNDQSLAFEVKDMSEETTNETIETNPVAEDIQLSETEEAVTVTPDAEDTQEPETVEASFSREFGQKMLEKYGNEGLRLAFEGKSEAEIIEHFSAAKDAEIESLKQQLAAAQQFQGEDELSASTSDDTESKGQRLERAWREKQAAYPAMAAIIQGLNEKDK